MRDSHGVVPDVDAEEAGLKKLPLPTSSKLIDEREDVDEEEEARPSSPKSPPPSPPEPDGCM